MPIATFSRQDLPAGFVTKTHFFKIEHQAEAISLIDMTCPHRGGPLTHGTSRDPQHVVCPWHGGRINRCKLEQRTQPTITTSDRVMFVLDSALVRVFRSIPVDSHWRETK